MHGALLSNVVVHPAADATVMPWRNGGGSTSELVRVPLDGEYDWRLSVATVAVDGPFSVFAGFDRVIWLLSGNGMDLCFEGDDSVVTLRCSMKPFTFAGERAVRATLVDGSTTDLNLMWRRGRYDVAAARVDLDGAASLGESDARSVVYVAAGSLVLGDQGELSAGDAADWTGRLRCRGQATVLHHQLVLRRR